MNTLSLTQSEFDKLMKSADFEQYTKEQFDSFIISNEELLIKANGTSELDDLEKSEYNIINSEINSFSMVEVWGLKEGTKSDIQKSVCYIRPKQVEWTEELIKSEGSDEMIKSKSGVYTDTYLNRKLGRVGQRYGNKSE